MTNTDPDVRTAATPGLVTELISGTVAVAAAYALAYSAHLGYYGAFQMTTEEGGLTLTNALPRLSLGATVVLLALGIGAAIAIGLAMLAARWRDPSWFRPVSVTAAVVILLAGVSLVLPVKAFSADWWTPMSVMAGAIVAALVVLRARPQLPNGVAAILTALILFSGLSFTVNATAFQVGRKLAVGQRSALLPLIGVTPPVVKLQPKDPTTSSPVSANELLLLIGNTDTTYTLLGCADHRVYRVARENFSVVADQPERFRGSEDKSLC